MLRAWLLCCALLLLGCGVKSAREANHRATEKPALQRTVSTSVQSQDEADGAGPSRVAGVGRPLLVERGEVQQVLDEEQFRSVLTRFQPRQRMNILAGFLSGLSNR